MELTLPLLGKVYLINLILLSLRYMVFSGIAYFVFWVWKKEKFLPHRIQKKFPNSEKIFDEIKYSFSTFLIFSCVGVGIFTARRLGFTKIYTEINEYGYTYFIFSIVAALLIHDAYFYFAHRLMHHKFLFKTFHSVHHNSTNPSPFAAFSFHPLEAILEAGILPILVFTIPLHPLAIVTFLLFMTGLNVLGHLGVELYPSNFVTSKWTAWNNTSFHHNMHHQKFNCNYGLYFNWWDKLFNTNHKDYIKEYVRTTELRDSELQNNNLPMKEENLVIKT